MHITEDSPKDLQSKIANQKKREILCHLKSYVN